MPKQKKERAERVKADNILYFFLHNILSVFLFFIISIQFNLYNLETNDSFSILISGDFWIVVFEIFIFSIISGIISRIVVFFGLRIYFYYYRNKVMKTWTSLNKGWNKISIAFFISSFITAILYVIGFLQILQNSIFSEATLLTLIGAYAILKVSVFIIVRTITEIKL